MMWCHNPAKIVGFKQEVEKWKDGMLWDSEPEMGGA